MIIYTVKPGDTIYKIAKKYDIDVERMRKENALYDSDVLVVGQSLVLIPRQHQVEPGDTVYLLGERYQILPEDIIAANPQVRNPRFLVPGTSLTIPHQNSSDAILVNGYAYPFLDLLTLEESLPFLTFLSVFSYEARPDGSLSDLADEKVLELISQYSAKPVMVVSNIGESGGFEGGLAHEILTDERSQNHLIDEILEVLDRKGYYGVDLDFENLDPDDRDPYNSFLEKISGVLHSRGYTLSAAIEKKTGPDVRVYNAHDYEAHGVYDDYVILMTYDWGYLFGPPFPIAPVNEIRKVLDYAVTEIPPEKILLGIPNYAFDWTLPYEEGDSASPLSHVDAVHLAREQNAEIIFDEGAKSPWFVYRDAAGREHIVWFEDARSIAAKLELVREYRLGGISYWTVNKSFPQNWEVLQETFRTRKHL